MNKLSKYLWIIMACFSLTALQACNEGPMEEAGEEIDDAVDDAGDAIDDATN